VPDESIDDEVMDVDRRTRHHVGVPELEAQAVKR
jgi:hypothetical protein